MRWYARHEVEAAVLVRVGCERDSGGGVCVCARARVRACVRVLKAWRRMHMHMIGMAWKRAANVHVCSVPARPRTGPWELWWDYGRNEVCICSI